MTIQEIARILENKSGHQGNVSFQDLAKKAGSPLILREEQAPQTNAAMAVNPISGLMESGKTAGNKRVLTEVVL